MVTIAIAAIVVGMAIPSFTGTIRSNQLATNANELITALNFARSEAIKRGVQVTVRRLGNDKQVWENGWEVFTDLNGNGTFNDNGDDDLCEADEDCLLRVFDALPLGYTLRTGANYSCWLAFVTNGEVKGSGTSCNGGLGNDTFRLCDDSQTQTNSRSIAIMVTGRARVSTGTASCP
ncbi:MAG: type IVa pilus pseudopilin TppE [Methylomicrobium sp.]